MVTQVLMLARKKNHGQQSAYHNLYPALHRLPPFPSLKFPRPWIGVKFNLGSLWKNKHHIRKARTEHRQSREALALAREGVENAVQANYTNLLTSYTEVKTQQKQVELANQNYSVVQNRYQNDLALLTDMVDASNMKLSAEMALINARISMLYNFYTLKYVTNTL